MIAAVSCPSTSASTTGTRGKGALTARSPSTWNAVRLPDGVEQYVRRLEVAMQDATLVGVVNGTPLARCWSSKRQVFCDAFRR